MLLELSIAITYEKGLVVALKDKYVPESARIIKKRIAILRYNEAKFFEKISTPKTLCIAEKLGKLIDFFL
jgi:hypothetical protein